jgi:hypothetical protein
MLRTGRSISPVDQAFARAVQRAGGLLVKDLLPTGTDLPDNADYVFPEYKVIAELERLEKNLAEDRQSREDTSRLHREWMLQGKVPPVWGTVQINLRQLPLECAHQIVSLFRKPIYRRVRKANGQIKSTKKILQMEDATGLLIVVHDGDFSVPPEAAVNLLSRSLNGDLLSSIDNIIYTNADMAAIRRGDPLRYQFFMHFYRKSDRIIPADLIKKLNVAWREELESLIGAKFDMDYYGEDLKPFLETLQFARPALRPERGR